MDSNSQLQHLVWLVPDLKDLDGVEELQRHRGDLGSVTISVTSRQTGNDHVSVTDRLNLKKSVTIDQYCKKMSLLITPAPSKVLGQGKDISVIMDPL